MQGDVYNLYIRWRFCLAYSTVVTGQCERNRMLAVFCSEVTAQLRPYGVFMIDCEWSVRPPVVTCKYWTDHLAFSHRHSLTSDNRHFTSKNHHGVVLSNAAACNSGRDGISWVLPSDGFSDILAAFWRFCGSLTLQSFGWKVSLLLKTQWLLYVPLTVTF
jgi:hypothetical protein